MISFLYYFSAQEADGSYFESFTALSWKRENRRLSAIRNAEARAEKVPEQEFDPQAQQQQLQEDELERPDQKEQLYIDVLYTIANTVGAPAPGGQVSFFILFFFQSLVMILKLNYSYIFM